MNTHKDSSSILHLIDSGGMYGAEKVVLTLLNELKNTNYPGILGCIRQNDSEIPQIAKDAKRLGISIEYFTMKRGLNYFGIRRISKYISENNIRLVHSHGYKSNIFLSVIRNKKYKTITTVHGWAKNTAGLKARIYELADSISLKKIDKVIAVSEAVIKDLEKNGLNAEKISLIYNGIETNQYEQDIDITKIREKYTLSSDDYVIGAIGRLAKVKGHSYLIDAIPLILKEKINCKLIIAGEGPLREQLLAMIEKYGLTGHVQLLGYTNKIHEIMSMIDLFVLPSLSEGLPISLLEAMAYGKPILASECGGIPEVITNDVKGIMVPPENSEEIAKGVKKFYLQKDKAVKIYAENKRYVDDMFSSRNMANQYIKLYKSLMQ